MFYIQTSVLICLKCIKVYFSYVIHYESGKKRKLFYQVMDYESEKGTLLLGYAL